MSVQTVTRNDRFLRRALLLDALFEAACGVGGIAAANTLAVWTGLLSPTLFTLIGAGCLGYAALFCWLFAQPRINRRLTRDLMLINDAFAIGAILLLVVAWGSLATGAIWLVGLLAVDAATLGLLEYEGLRRLR